MKSIFNFQKTTENSENDPENGSLKEEGSAGNRW